MGVGSCSRGGKVVVFIEGFREGSGRELYYKVNSTLFKG